MALVVSRKEHEAIIMEYTDGTKVRISVYEDKSSHLLRLRIEAPREVKIFREELLTRPTDV